VPLDAGMPLGGVMCLSGLQKIDHGFLAELAYRLSGGVVSSCGGPVNAQKSVCGSSQERPRKTAPR
jgi:hypothetical protein